jgi:hypothetical protein
MSLADAATGRGVVIFRVVHTNVEQRGLGRSMLAQFGHLVDVAFHRLILFALNPALGLVSLSLLSCVFLLAFCKC